MTRTGIKELKEVYDPFQSAFQAGAYTDEERAQIIETTNTMLSKRMTNQPYFKVYLQALDLVKKNDQESKHFTAWHQIIDGMLADENWSSREFKIFVDFTIDFLETRLLKSSNGGTNWTTDSEDFQFAFQQNIPSLVWESTTLKAFRKTDTMSIKESPGRFFPMELKWFGEKGKVDWDSTGLEGNIYVTFGAYELDLKKSFYQIDTATFYFDTYFGSRAVAGAFEDKITSKVGNRLPSYPRFSSFEGDLQIDNFGEGVKYQGGFSIQGETIYGDASDGQKASIQLFNKSNQPIFKGTSDRFTIKSGVELTGQDINAVFTYDQDSIAHPSANIRYNIPEGRLELSRGENGSDRNLFFSSAHNININTDYIIANINTDTIFIGKKTARILGKEPVTFQSLNFFNKREYESLEGLAGVNPLVMLMRLYRRNGNNPIVSANQVLSVYSNRLTKESLASFLYSLSEEGFVSYDQEKELVEIKEKTRHYVEAYYEQRDYDRLRVKSDTLDVNGYFNVKDKAISVRGVKNLEISPARRVGVLPEKNQIILKPGMDFDFAGTLFAGYSDFKGKDFHFEYRPFQVKMDSIDQFRFFPPTKDPVEFSNSPAYALNSKLENLNGTLYIDSVGNKSGLDTIAIYPLFKTTDLSYVYYDDSTVVADTVYHRDSFYFEVAPFEFPGLQRYLKEDIAFEGQLVSTGIFPPFKDTAVVRDDYSLGFVHETPEEGYVTYGGQGLYQGLIDLSNKGLTGKGTLAYLGSVIESTDFIFRPDGATSSAQAFDLPESRGGEVETPMVHADKVTMDFKPYQDSMYIISEEFKLFAEQEHSLKGVLTLTTEGVKGDGTLKWDKAELESEIFSFGANSIEADTMSVQIKSLERQEAMALSTENLKGKIDFDDNKGTFESNDDDYVYLNRNGYISTMNAFDWDLEKDLLTLQRDDRNFGAFTSVIQGQDSLTFLGKNATIDVTSNDVIVSEVPYINSADAIIYPDSNLVTIQPQAVIKTLENAVIVADSINKTHKIVKATVDILGRKSYKASGFYEYNIAGKEQEIEFSDIQGKRVGKGKISERPTATIASGTVEDVDSFFIDQKTTFKGNISLYSESVNLKFEGFAKLEAEKLENAKWFGINCEADKNNLIIPFNYPRDEEGYKAYTGLYLRRDIPIVYPSIMSAPYALQDRKILDVTGVFKYDKAKDEFIFGDSSKVIDDAYLGNLLVFENKTGKIRGEGKLGIAGDLKYTSLDAYGSIETVLPPDIPDSLRAETPPPPVTVDALAGVNFILPERLFRYVLAEVERNTLSLNPTPYLANQEKYKKQFSMMFPGTPGLTESFNGFALGKFELPKAAKKHTILVSDLKMKWDMDFQTWVSTSPKVGLVSINGAPINRQVDAFIEYKMGAVGGDRFYYYLKFPSQIYYYFGFKQGVLEVYSNDTQFMDACEKMKKTELVTKMPGGDTYEILVETANRANMFVRRVRAMQSTGN